MEKMIVFFVLNSLLTSCSISQSSTTETTLEAIQEDFFDQEIILYKNDSLHSEFLSELSTIVETLNFEIISLSEQDSLYEESVRDMVIYTSVQLDNYGAISKVEYHTVNSPQLNRVAIRFEELLLELVTRSTQFVSIDRVNGENRFNIILVFDDNGFIKYYNAF